jgi:hypothetical protein
VATHCIVTPRVMSEGNPLNNLSLSDKDLLTAIRKSVEDKKTAKFEAQFKAKIEAEFEHRLQERIRAEMEAAFEDRVKRLELAERAVKLSQLQLMVERDQTLKKSSKPATPFELHGRAGNSSDKETLLDLHRVAHLLEPNGLPPTAPRCTLPLQSESTHSMTTRSGRSSRNVTGMTTPRAAGAKRFRDDDEV